MAQGYAWCNVVYRKTATIFSHARDPKKGIEDFSDLGTSQGCAKSPNVGRENMF